MQSNSKAKQKRRRQGKHWISQYTGNRILHAYKKQFKIPLITAVNDLEAIGVKLDDKEVAQIKLNRHHYNQQKLPKKELERLTKVVQRDTESW